MSSFIADVAKHALENIATTVAPILDSVGVSSESDANHEAPSEQQQQATDDNVPVGAEPTGTLDPTARDSTACAPQHKSPSSPPHRVKVAVIEEVVVEEEVVISEVVQHLPPLSPLTTPPATSATSPATTPASCVTTQTGTTPALLATSPPPPASASQARLLTLNARPPSPQQQQQQPRLLVAPMRSLPTTARNSPPVVMNDIVVGLSDGHSSSSDDSEDDEDSRGANATAAAMPTQATQGSSSKQTSSVTPVKPTASSPKEHEASDDDYRVTADTNGKLSAECRRCGRVIAYKAGSVNTRRHANACLRNATESARHISTAAPSAKTAKTAPVAKIAAKRKDTPRRHAPATQSPHDSTAVKAKKPKIVRTTKLTPSTVKPKTQLLHDSSVGKSTAAAIKKKPTASPSAQAMQFNSKPARATTTTKPAKAKTTAIPSTPSALSLAAPLTPSRHSKRANVSAEVAWVVGSKANAVALRAHYRASALTVRAPVSRFQELIHESLHDLRAVDRILATPHATRFSVFVTTPSPVPQSAAGASTAHTGMHNHSNQTTATTITTDSKLEACAMLDHGFALAFPVPPTIVDRFVAPLAQELQAVSDVRAASSVQLYCCRAGGVIPWQFFKDDCFVVLLGGRVEVRTAPSVLKYPPCDSQLLNLAYSGRRDALTAQQQQAVAMYAQLISTSTNDRLSVAARLQPPCEDDDARNAMAVDDDDSDSSSGHATADAIAETLLTPGSVLYMPGGTWFTTCVVDNSDATWLKVRIASSTPALRLGETITQLCVAASEQWRQPLTQTHAATATRKQLGAMFARVARALATQRDLELLPDEALLLGDNEALERVMVDRMDVKRAKR